MNSLTLSVATRADAFFADVCAFEAAFLKEAYDAYPILTNDVVVAIHDNNTILAAATYASGVSNNPLIAEVAAPDAFLQPDGTPFPRAAIAEYAGRMFNDALVTSMATRLQFADVLNLSMYRIARLSNKAILTCLVEKGEKALHRRINLISRAYPASRNNLESTFNDRWDIYFNKTRRVMNIVMHEQTTDGIKEWRDAIGHVPALTDTSQAEKFLL